MIAEVLSNGKDERTTARRLIEYFGNRGIDASRIGSEQLLPLYKLLSRSAWTALQWTGDSDRPEASNLVEDEVWGVLVETRRHPALEYVVSRFVRKLGIGVQVFHGPSNEEFIKKSTLSELIGQRKVILSPLQNNSFSPRDYNALLLSKSFWSALYGRRKILIFQSDAMICGQSDYRLEDFLEFDYIGAKWPRQRPVGMVIDGGCGGLSLRDWKKSVESLERFPVRHWPGGEDGFFAFHIELIGGRVGTPGDCAKFATQGEFLERSFGAHKISELPAESLERFLEYCPECKFFLEKGITD